MHLLSTVVTLVVTLSTPTLAIIGGGATGGNFYEYTVALYQPAIAERAATPFICDGVLVGPSTVVTIAECVQGLTKSELTVRAGLTRATYKTFNTSSITVHPNYNSDTLANDVAIIKLSTPIRNIAAANLAPSNWGYPDRNQTVIGWGSTKNNTQALSTSLRSVTVSPMAADTCAKKLSSCKYTLDSAQHYCTVAKQGKGWFYGDAGGPIINPDGLVVGLVSGSPICAQPDGIALELRVSHFHDWIMSHVTKK